MSELGLVLTGPPPPGGRGGGGGGGGDKGTHFALGNIVTPDSQPLVVSLQNKLFRCSRLLVRKLPEQTMQSKLLSTVKGEAAFTTINTSNISIRFSPCPAGLLI